MRRRWEFFGLEMMTSLRERRWSRGRQPMKRARERDSEKKTRKHSFWLPVFLFLFIRFFLSLSLFFLMRTPPPTGWSLIPRPYLSCPMAAADTSSWVEGCVGLYRVVPGCTGLYRVLAGRDGRRWDLSGSKRVFWARYWVQNGFDPAGMGSNWVQIGLSWFPVGYCQVLRASTRLRWVLLD